MVGLSHALYDGNHDVIQLTESDFNNKVLKSDEMWIVEFFAPWCGHCQKLVPEYMKLANALKVGAVDMTQHQSVGAQYNIQGFPTIKIFGANKKVPLDYQGQFSYTSTCGTEPFKNHRNKVIEGPRTAQAMADSLINELRKTVNAKLGISSSSKSRGANDEKSSGKYVIELTDNNFEE
ncbi:unnamed protein product, partial [Wuchereria bancrofti]